MRSVVICAVIALAAPVPALGQSIAHAPTPRGQASWIQGDHYPAAAYKAKAQGRVAFTLTVDPKGRPSACRITQTSGNADLDGTTCNLFQKNARFDPAVDDKGMPAVGEWSGAMRWTLPQ